MEMQSTHRRRWRGLVLEGIAVLIGVLLAFTVDSLAEARAERQVEQAYLVALADEVGSNTVLLKNLVATTRNVSTPNRSTESAR